MKRLEAPQGVVPCFIHLCIPSAEHSAQHGVSTLQHQLLPPWPLGAHYLTSQAHQPYPSPRGVEEHTLKSALKAQNAPLSLLFLSKPLHPLFPPVTGWGVGWGWGGAAKPWILLEVEFPLTHF